MALLANFGATTKAYRWTGDADGDSKTSLVDLAITQGLYGSSVDEISPSAQPAAAATIIQHVEAGTDVREENSTVRRRHALLTRVKHRRSTNRLSTDVTLSTHQDGADHTLRLVASRRTRLRETAIDTVLTNFGD